MKTENSRKYLLIFSGLLLAHQHLGLVIDGNIPYTQIKLSSQTNLSIVLTILVFFWGTQLTYYWFKQKKEDKNLFEYASSISISLIAIVPVCYNYLKNYGIDWKVIASTILTFSMGVLLAIAVDFMIAIIFSLRSSEEMKKMGLGKIPSASKAFIRRLFFLIPLNVAIYFLLITYKHLLPVPIANYWYVLFLCRLYSGISKAS